MDQRSTIAAIASPPGQGAIAIIRISGENSFSICEKIFFPTEKQIRISEQPGYTIHYGTIKHRGKIIDKVLLSIFKAPRSYTGEDLIEISCHGSVYIQQKILQILISHGAALAGPGEFTQRAFLNGKMDLSQAEAVSDLITSESEAFQKVAMNQMRGGFSSELKTLRSRLLEFISLVELELDFSEEDVEFADRSELKILLSSIESMLGSLKSSFAFGNVLKNGIPVVIAGKPNVGKSTLLNILLKEEKALVSEVPGTTRDSIEDVIHLGGMTFRFIDTAGIRETTDKVEIMGIKRTMEKIRQARIILLMAEATDTPEHIDHLVFELRKKKEFEGKKLILILNKIDLSRKENMTEASGKIVFPSLNKDDSVLEISAKTQHGLEDLKEMLVSTVQEGRPGENDLVVTNLRHYEALKNAHEAVIRASEGLENMLPGDLLAMDIREVLHYLGEITGEITTDEILGNIFKNFCIGK